VGLTCSFAVPGEPLSWNRSIPVARRNGKIAVVKSASQRTNQHTIAAYGLQARPREWRTDWNAYRIEIHAYRSGYSGDWDNIGKEGSDSLQAPKVRKGVSRAGRGILWDDDGQIKDGRVVIHEGVDPKEARLEVIAEMIGDVTVEQARASRQQARRERGNRSRNRTSTTG